MIEVDSGLFTILSGDAQLTALDITGVFRAMAPEGVNTPYVIFQQSHGDRDYTLGRESFRTVLYMVKAVTGGDEEVGEDQEPAAAIDRRIETLLVDNHALVVAPWHVIELRRQMDIEYPESSNGQTFQHIGGLYRIRLSL